MIVFLIAGHPSVLVVLLAVTTYVTVGQRIYHVWYQYEHLSQDDDEDNADAND